jgi:hypothetical protein
MYGLAECDVPLIHKEMLIGSDPRIMLLRKVFAQS